MKQITFILMFVAMFAMNMHGQTGGMIVSPGTTVTLEPGTTLGFSNGNLLLKDDLSTTPSFLQKGTVNYDGSGDSRVEQYLTKDVWHIVSPSVQNEMNGTYMWMYLYNWTETTWSWQFMNQPINQPLNAGQGYYVWAYDTDPNGGGYQTSPDSVVLNGILNHQDLNLNLSVTDASPKSGWNLLGNPFPCGLDWNGNTDWNLTNLDATIWIWDPVAGNHKTWNPSTGGSLQSGEIAASQGFWVHADDTTGSIATSITLPASQRVHTTNNFYKNSSPIISNQLKLRVQGNTLENDECIIGFSEGATLFPNHLLDALYLEGNETAPSMYSNLLGKHYAMKQLSSWEEHNAVALGFRAGVPGNYTIDIAWIESFPQDLPIWLEDKQEGFFQDLRQQGQYHFVANLNDTHDRFILHFGDPMGIDNQKTTDMINIYAYEKNVYLDIPIEDFSQGRCIIYNMTGKKVADENVVHGLNQIPADFNIGFYLVTLNSDNGFVSDKVFIK